MNLFSIILATITALVPEAPEQDRLAAAISDAAEERPIFPEDDDGLHTASLLVSVAYWESGRSFDCSRVGDNGHSVSCFQLWATSKAQHELLRADVFEAAREARDRLAASMYACRRLPVPERLAQFTTGRCITNRESRMRWRTHIELLRGLEEVMP